MSRFRPEAGRFVPVMNRFQRIALTAFLAVELLIFVVNLAILVYLARRAWRERVARG